VVIEPIVAIVRPTKRRKVLPRQQILDEIVSEVYSLLGSQDAPDLDGLKQIVA
jgi:hypothetical protein